MKKTVMTFLVILMVLTGASVYGQTDSTAATTPPATPAKKKWYEWMDIGGYVHIRYNRFLSTNNALRCDQCDKGIGQNGGITFRRARLKFSGSPHDRVFIYVQLDVATNSVITLNGVTPITGQNFAQLRDFYGDIFLNGSKTFKLRAGLSKIPVSFDDLQSSQNRIAFDRTDAMNSMAYNERDMGLFLYYTPKPIKDRYKMLVSEGLKGSGDYGIFGVGIYNGQTMNRVEGNDNVHVIGRVTYPFKIGSQIIEPGASAFTGYYNTVEIRSAGVAGDKNILDQRVTGSVILYPQPFGIQAEYTVGNGPEFTKLSPTSFSITNKNLSGGYVQLAYRQVFKKNIFIPYTRFQYYSGGKKIERDSRSYTVRELEMGVEWEPIRAIEVTVAYMISERRYEDSVVPVNMQYGNLLRLQLQFNY